jgi:hypothetical protein
VGALGPGGSRILSFANTIGIWPEVIIAIELGLSDFDVIVESLVGVAARRGQSASLGERNRGVCGSAVVVPTDVLAAGWRGQFIVLVEDARWAAIKCVKRGLAAQEAGTARSRVAGRKVPLSLPLHYASALVFGSRALAARHRSVLGVVAAISHHVVIVKAAVDTAVLSII